MTQPPDYTLTRAGYERLTRELEDYRARRAGQQDEMDDISQSPGENYQEEGAEFEAKTSREFIDERIGNLELILSTAQVIDDDPDVQTVDVGDRVTLFNVEDNEEVQYDLIGGAEAMYGREGVSMDSPVGSALLKRRVGDVIEVYTAEGNFHYAIRRIERTPGSADDQSSTPEN